MRFALGLIGRGGVGPCIKGMDDITKTLPTATSTTNGKGRTSGCFSMSSPQRKQTGSAPLGGFNTTAGPQQQDGQR